MLSGSKHTKPGVKRCEREAKAYTTSLTHTRTQTEIHTLTHMHAYVWCYKERAQTLLNRATPDSCIPQALCFSIQHFYYSFTGEIFSVFDLQIHSQNFGRPSVVVDGSGPQMPHRGTDSGKIGERARKHARVWRGKLDPGTRPPWVPTTTYIYIYMLDTVMSALPHLRHS